MVEMAWEYSKICGLGRIFWSIDTFSKIVCYEYDVFFIYDLFEKKIFVLENIKHMVIHEL